VLSEILGHVDDLGASHGITEQIHNGHVELVTI
jgi:hypothetical protein